MKTQFLIAATSIAAAVAVAAPAGARTVAPPPMAPIAMQSTTPSPTQRICVVDTITGSRIPTKVCRTRAEWAKLGLDPFAK